MKQVINDKILKLINESTKFENEYTEELTKLGFDVYATPEYEHNTYLVVCKAKNLWFAQSCEINKTFIEYAKLEFDRIERENDHLD